jgi:hypothetical protein
MKAPKHRKQMNITFDRDFVSTLSDPAWQGLFADVSVAGKAADSLTRAIAGEYVPSFGSVVRVTPQQVDKLSGMRGSRVDVEVQTDSNEIVVYELQILTDKTLSQRNILKASHVFANRMPEGEIDYEAHMCRVIVINICCFNVREENENGDVVQPVQLRYGKKPHDLADDQYEALYVQMPQFLAKEKVDFNEPLDCWLFTLWKCHELKKKPDEVAAMYPQLQQYASRDDGFSQFCSRFNYVSADETTRNTYLNWLLYQMNQRGVIASAVESAVETAIEGEREKWQEVVAKKEEVIARQAEENARQAEENARLAEELARLRAMSGQK